MGVCCVDGCQDIKDGIVYFEFPTRKSLRRKWLDVLNIGSKVAIGTVVCSQHFSSDEYEVVRGKVRLKSKVVPTLLLQNKSEDVKITEETSLEPVTVTGNSKLPDEKLVENSPLPDEKIVETSVLPDDKIVGNSVLPNEKMVESTIIPEKKTVESSLMPDKATVENTETPQPDSTTGNTFEPIQNTRKERRRQSKGKRKRKSSEICKVIVKDSTESSSNSVEREIFPDPKQQPDFEDMITNYQIKNSKPNSLLPQEMEIDIPRGGERDDAIIVDDQGDAPPVFIEIAVDKDNNTNEAGNEDCLIVLESVQVDIDPSSLMLPEPDSEEEVACDLVEEEKAPDKNQDPVSLLTSSDEDDVILEEPHIDTVEVSDETDEDDMPLVKLVKKAKPPKQKSTKNQKEVDTSLKKLFWKRMYDFYCMQCNFTTMDSLTYNNHLKEHHKVIQVCSVCSYTTASKTQFTKHLRKHGKKYRCHLCDHVATHNVSLVYHLQTHKMCDSYIERMINGSKCKKCGFFSEHQKIVLNHVRACGSNAKMYPCDQCSHIAVRKEELKSHWRRKHQGSVVEVYSDSSYE